MNENLPLKAPVISQWLTDAAHQLTHIGIDSAKLDAEIILAHTLRKNRTYLHAHNDELLTDRQLEIADARLRLRLDRTPIAYIIGHKEFYGRQFRVTPATLIPRPESETIITMLKELAQKNTALLNQSSQTLVDVGTGTGCLGITAKLEIPALDVTLLDISRHALTVAIVNATKLQASTTTTQSDLLTTYPFAANYILANLPYVDPTWERSPETSYEPELALFAEDNGLRLIKKLLEQTSSHLASRGIVLLEADPRQHESIIAIAKNHDLTHVETRGFILSFHKTS